MATPLVQLSDISYGYGQDRLFDDLSFVVHPGDRLALVGRNGSGKSSLMKLIAGRAEPDDGLITYGAKKNIQYMDQDPDMEQFSTLGDFALQDVGPAGQYKIDRAADGLKFEPERLVSAASGGERRRAALARILAQEPDLMLLDEPTNHLDISAILWLEAELKTTNAAFILISHDRAFLTALSQVCLWLDRGQAHRLEKDFSNFEAWRDKLWADEDMARHKLNRKIKSEAKWAVEGISARRKRNQGRVRALQALRAERVAQIKRQGSAALDLQSGQKSGRKVIEVKDLNYTVRDIKITHNFNLILHRGDKLGLVGPNGVGKTTLLRLLMQDLSPDSGSVKHGSNLRPAYFDQNRALLDPAASLWENLTLDKSMRVSGSSDQVMVRGTPRHVVGYLKDFLFDEDQARAPVRSLSGGERARLLLARIMAQDSNFLILDEPTNDLDVETLDLLQDVLGAYEGTVLLVSHDRDFLDRVVTSTLQFEGNGVITHHAGGWSDIPKITTKQDNKKKAKTVTKAENLKQITGLSFAEKHRLEKLPSEIDRLEQEIKKLEEFLSQPDLYDKEPAKFAKASDGLVERQTALQNAEEEWLTLAEKAES